MLPQNPYRRLVVEVALNPGYPRLWLIISLKPSVDDEAGERRIQAMPGHESSETVRSGLARS